MLPSIPDELLKPVLAAELVVGFLVIYTLGLLIGRYLKRRRGVRLGFLYHIFIIALAAFVPLRFTGIDFANDFWDLQRELRAALVLLGTIFFLALLDRFFWDSVFQRQDQRTGVPKFLRDVVAILLTTASIVLVVAVVYGKTAPGLLAGSGILAIILGFALQDLLGNVFSGIALEIGRPFRPGDWLMIDGRFARVIDLNWRSVRVITNDDITHDIPNNQVARNTIINLTYPSANHAMRFSVGIEYGAAPNRVKEIFQQAVRGVRGVLAQPAPHVYLTEFGDSSISYELKFYMNDHALYHAACDAIRTNLWYGLKRAGIKIPFPIRTVQIDRPRKLPDATERACKMLRQFPILADLDDAQLTFLVESGRQDNYGRRERILEQGAPGESMFILLEGQAEVTVASRDGRSTLVATLHSGDCFGEISLLTGEPRGANVIAATDCEVLEIGKASMSKLLHDSPELATCLGNLLADRQLENEIKRSEVLSDAIVQSRQRSYSQVILRKLTNYFGL